MCECVCVWAELDTFAKSASQLFVAQEKSSAKYANALFNTHQQFCVQKLKIKRQIVNLNHMKRSLRLQFVHSMASDLKWNTDKKAALFIQ